MATLVSPGVDVQIIDQSQYLPAGSNSVPLVLLATAQNKSAASGTTLATGTSAANANKLYEITSQRDLINTFGTPFFYKTSSGAALQGYELNEYGLHTAYSVLGATNKIYALRADIDLASLIGSASRPSGAPADGTWWLDSANSQYGIHEWNATTRRFVLQSPIIITDEDDLASTSTGQPKARVGNIGDYAVVLTNKTANPTTYDTYWYKAGEYLDSGDASYNTWVPVGRRDWRMSVPAIKGGATGTMLAGNLEISSGTTYTQAATATSAAYKKTITLTTNNITTLAAEINSANLKGVTASVLNGKLNIFADHVYVHLADGTANWAGYGIQVGTHSMPRVTRGTNSEQPNWKLVTNFVPAAPSGSVFLKQNAVGNGASLSVSRYSSSTGAFASVSAPIYATEEAATNAIDGAGGKNIALNSVFATAQMSASNMVLRRRVSKTAVFTASETNFTWTTSADANFAVSVSEPGSAELSTLYTVTLPSTGGVTKDADWFIDAWTSAQIPYTKCYRASSGALVLEHTEGGSIVLYNYGYTSTPYHAAGFDDSSSATYGPIQTITLPIIGSGVSITGTKSGLTAGDIKISRVTYSNLTITGFVVDLTTAQAEAGQYAIGDIIEINNIPASFRTDTTIRAVVTSLDGSGNVTGLDHYDGRMKASLATRLSAWQPFEYTADETSPRTAPSNKTNWFYSVLSTSGNDYSNVDIMVNSGTAWIGYRRSVFDSDGIYNATTSSGLTDPSGVQITGTAPESQSDGTALVHGDLWIDSSDLENYPLIYRWQEVEGISQWVQIDTTDQVSENGIVFADARWAASGSIDPLNDPIPSVKDMLVSNYVDLDAPDPTLYPRGMLLFNTRRSSYNIKQFRTNYFIQANYVDAGAYDSNNPSTVGNLPQYSYTWVSVSGLKTNGQAYMGRKAQRAMVVAALSSAINTNTEIREEERFFNLIACPGYPELQPEMIKLNNDRNQTAFIIGDTPMRLADNANDLTAWATNKRGADATGEDGLVTRNTYLGIFYPSGLDTDLSGTRVVVPASHMMLRTMLYNDTVAYPWLAPAGMRRGVVDNALSIGYIDSASGEYVTTKIRNSTRDVLYTNFINPISEFANIGLLNYGNKTSYDSQSALDRINVARLICFIRERLQVAVRPFIFEPNDTITRNEVRSVVQTLLADILTKRGLYDYLVVCDTSNNTPARIDKNELWVDIAIEPVKAVEFIYIPVRIMNTGEIASL